MLSLHRQVHAEWARRGRLLALLVVLLGVTLSALGSMALGRAQDAERSASETRREHDRRLAALRALTDRLDNVHFPALLGPEVAATPAGPAALRASLERFHGLLAERRAVLEQYLNAARRLSDGLGPAAAQARLEADRLRREAHALEQGYRQLDQRQTLLAQKVGAVLAWYGVNGAAIVEREGRRQVAEPADRAALEALRDEVRVADSDVRTSLRELGALAGGPAREERSRTASTALSPTPSSR